MNQRPNDDKDVETIGEARDIARHFASNENVSETRAEAIAEAWFDAGKDYDACRGRDLRAHLQRHLKG